MMNGFNDIIFPHQITTIDAIDCLDGKSASVRLDAIEELMLRLSKEDLYEINRIANRIAEDWKNGDME